MQPFPRKREPTETVLLSSESSSSSAAASFSAVFRLYERTSWRMQSSERVACIIRKTAENDDDDEDEEDFEIALNRYTSWQGG
jgi:hypothetical protein